MAFNLLDLFAPAATNRLINAAPIGGQSQNMLVSRDIPQDTQLSSSFPLPAPDPQTTSVVQSPAPLPVAGTQIASATQSNPSLLDKYQQFWDSDRGSRLRDMFAGWAMGTTPQQSLALGAANMSANSKERTAKNQTLAWLKGRGVSDDEATFLAGNPNALGDYLKNVYAAQRNQGLLNVGKGAALYDPNSKQWITPPEGADGGTEYGLAPVYGKDASGNTVIGQLGKNGEFHQTQLPEGFTPTPGISNIDTGTGTLTINSKTGTPIAATPKDIAGENQQKASGTAQGQAQAALPAVEGAANQLLSSIDSLDKDPYLPQMLGPVNSRKWNLSADSERVKSKMDQIGGQSFLQAYNTLRGAGQITEVEGQKATAAMARLNTAQNEQDYREALGELRGIVQNSVQRARQQAGVKVDNSSSSATPDFSKMSDDELKRIINGQ